MNALDRAHKIIEALEDKKGEDILLLDIKDVATFTDYFIICNGTSDRMLDALAKGVLEAKYIIDTVLSKRNADGDDPVNDLIKSLAKK